MTTNRDNLDEAMRNELARRQEAGHDARVSLVGDARFKHLSDEQLAAAIRAYKAAEGVGPVAVKPLEWVKMGWGWSGITPLGDYEVRPWQMHDAALFHPHGSLPALLFGEVDTAKAAAQADYEARIRSALATPQPSQSRDEVVEECIAELVRQKTLYLPGGPRDIKGAIDVAISALRALSASPQPQSRKGEGA